MGKPMLPRPMNPMSMIFSSPRHCEERKRRSNPVFSRKDAGLLRFARNNGAALSGLRFVEFGKDFARDAEAVDAAGDAGIDRDLHQDLANLLAADAVGERALDVGPQFVRPVQDR